MNRSGKSTHDVYVEIEGPSSSDVHHNFVQRWNEASDRDQADGLWPESSNHGDLPFPDKVALPGGEVPVQIQRTVRRGQYTYDTPAPRAERHPIAAGEFSIRDQYLSALAAARHSIYIEDKRSGLRKLLRRYTMRSDEVSR